MTNIIDIRQPIAKEFEQFKTLFAQCLQSDINVLQEIYEHILANSGKQIRPTLTLLSAKLCGNITEKTYDAAVVFELLHTASLLHDDVIDDTLQRRSKKSVNAQWTNKLAILSGDYMLSTAMRRLTKMRNLHIQNIVCDLVSKLSKGEILEINYGDSMWITEKHYFNIIRHKTASLFSACTEAGAISVGATGVQTKALRLFGEEMGICFQMQDDIFDYSDSEQLGKPTMNDIRDKKVTLPLIIALKRADKKDAAALKLRIENEPLTWELENDIKNFVMRYDGIGYAQQRINEHKKIAKILLTEFHPITPAYESLLQLLDYTTQRSF